MPRSPEDEVADQTGRIPLGPGLTISASEIEFNAIRAQGSGGQNVNKVSSAIHLRFDIPASSLPENLKERLLSRSDSRLGKDGVLVIKAQTHRTQPKNRAEALERLRAFIEAASHVPKPRTATRPTRAAKRRRLDSKQARGRLKATRRRPGSDD